MAQSNIRVGNIENVSGEVTIAGGDIYKGFTAEKVSALLTQITSTFQVKKFDGRCPYKGLDVFEEDDAELFFGREKLVDELAKRVNESRTVFITGPSGSGKSSLVRAGLIPALKHGAIKNSHRWRYETIKPGRDPLSALASAFSRLKSPELGKYFRENVHYFETLHECAESALSERKDQRLVLFIDQFEEVFTQVSKDETELFLNLLTHAAAVENGRIILLFAMRSDFVSNCAKHPELNDLLNRQFIQIGAMQPDELVSAIAQPALRVGLKIDPNLIAQIINDMQGEPGALPLMQFALKDLFDAQQAQGGVIALTLNDYLGRGGIRKALERHADNSFKKLNQHEQELTRSIFSSLIEIGHGTQDTRRTANFDELIPASVNTEEVQAIVRKLADARLITTDEIAGKDTVTIAHEKLIDAWPWLKKLMNENRETIALQNQIAEDAREWDTNQRDASYLYTGARLGTAREQLDKKKIVLSVLAQIFVDVGIHAQEAERSARQRRVRLTVIGLATTLVFISGLAIVAFQQRSQAIEQQNIARSRELALSAVAQLPIDPELSLLLATEAARISKTKQAEDVLRKAIMLSHVRTVLRGHTGQVFSAVYSPDGRFVLTASEDQTAQIWEIATGKVVELRGHSDALESAVFSHDGRLVLTASDDKTARIWDAMTGNLLGILREHKDVVWNAAFSPDDKRVITASKDGIALIWDIATGQHIGEISHRGKVYFATFSPDGRFVLTVSEDNTARVSDAQSGKMLAELRGQTGAFWYASFSPDSSLIVTACEDWTARVWEFATGTQKFILEGHAGRVHTTVFSPDGKWIVTASADGTARVWNALDGKPISTLRGHTGVVWGANFSPDARLVVTAGEDGTARIWDAMTGQSVAELLGHKGNVWKAVFSPDAKFVVTAGQDGTARIWDAGIGNIVQDLRTKPANIESAVFNQNGNLVVTARDDNTIQVWNARTGRILITLPNIAGPTLFSPYGDFLVTRGESNDALVLETANWKPVANLRGHTNQVTSLAFSPDGKFVATGSLDTTAKIWDVITGRMIFDLRGHTKGLTCIAFSPNGKLLATASDDNLALLWQVNTGQVIAELPGHEKGIKVVVFSPDGRFLVTASSDTTAKVWDVSTQQPVAELRGHTAEVFSAIFSSDSKFVVTAGRWPDNSARVWEISTSQNVTALTGHTGVLKSIAYSPDGRWVVTTSEDGTARVWNPLTGESIAELRGNVSQVNSASFSPDGKLVVTASMDGSAKIYDCDTCGNIDDLFIVAQRRVTRDLTPNEREIYLHDDQPVK